MKPFLLFCLGLIVCFPALAWYAPVFTTAAAQAGGAATPRPTPDTGSARRATVSRAVQPTEDTLWQPLDTPVAQSATEQVQAPADSRRLLQLNESSLQKMLASAPLEFSEQARTAPLVLTLPLPDGSLARFKVVESAVAAPELAAWLPQIKTYQGQGVDDPTMTARFDWSPTGLHGIILAGNESFFIEPQTVGDTSRYLAYDARTVESEKGRVACAVREAATALRQESRSSSLESTGQPRLEVTAGAQLRTYRMAIATTGEWTQQYGGGNVANAATAIVTLMNQINAIFEKEIAVRFIVVNNQAIIYANAATDPFANVSSAEELEKTQQTLDQVVGNANYDLGHLLGTTQGFSGLAGLGVVCNAPRKGQALSLMGGQLTNPINLAGYAHEIGHQFNAEHSFNGTTAGCAARATQSAWEPGSGTSIMSYVGSCNEENLQPNTELYFHIGSLEAMAAYITNNTCANPVTTGNNPPNVNAGANYTIPKETPFTLTATGNDPDGDAVTYSWEQLDLGAQGPPNTDDGQTRPLFRSFAPTANPARTFPQMQYVLAGNLPLTYQANGRTFLVGESYPTTTRTLNFRVTARDNRSGVNSGAMQVNVNAGAGPLIVTAPTADVRLAPGSQQTITWNVANTNAAPINATNVRLTLSTDGGVTFPTVLAASVPNNGQAQITLPNVAPTATARIKVEAVGNVFFNVSPGFAIGGVCATLTLGPAALPDAPVFMEYPAQNLTTEGGAAPYKYRVSTGALPRGMLLSEAGQLTGVPQDAGTFNFTITATDAAQCSSNKAYTLRVLPEATIADTGVTTGTAPGFAAPNARRASNEAAGKAVEFVVTLSAPSNERVTVFFATADGSARAGQNYQANSGTLIFAPGETEKRVSVMVFGATPGGKPTDEFFVNLFEPVNTALSDKHGACAILEEDSETCRAITFNTPPVLPAARVHEGYDQVLKAGGGEAIEFELAGGCLPAGLNLAANGRITGQPVQFGSFKFQIAAIDNEGCFDVREFTLNIGEPAACIVGFTPTTGQVGDNVTLLGVRFTNVREVRFGNRAARFVVNSENEIVATVPAEAVTGPLSVTTNNGIGNSTQSFTVLNSAPVAGDKQYTILRNQPLNARLTGSDVNGNALRFEIVNLEARLRGAVSLTNPATGAFTYTPLRGYVGDDVFFYRVSDGTLTSGIGKVTIKVIGAPRITSVNVQGFGYTRQLIVFGEYFDPDAIVLVNGKKLATRNDRQKPDSRLIAFLEPGVIKPDAQGVITLQVRNPDGSLSAEFSYRLPRW